jgi:hypothetical protein
MIFIEGNIPSSKNSRQWTGKYFIVSKTVQKYLKNWEYQWMDAGVKKKFKEMCVGKEFPYKIGMHFVRDSRRKYDYVNALQLPQDLMVKHGWILDDNTDVMYPFPLEVNGKYSSYNKEKPGVYLMVL